MGIAARGTQDLRQVLHCSCLERRLRVVFLRHQPLLYGSWRVVFQAGVYAESPVSRLVLHDRFGNGGAGVLGRRAAHEARQLLLRRAAVLDVARDVGGGGEPPTAEIPGGRCGAGLCSRDGRRSRPLEQEPAASLSPVQMSDVRRLEAIDILRGFLVICVVLGHAVQQYAGMLGPFWTEVNRIIYSFHMPDFVFVSGLCALRVVELSGVSEKRDYIRSRAVRLLVPYVVWGLIYFALRLVVGDIARIVYRMDYAWLFFFGSFAIKHFLLLQ